MGATLRFGGLKESAEAAGLQYDHVARPRHEAYKAEASSFGPGARATAWRFEGVTSPVSSFGNGLGSSNFHLIPLDLACEHLIRHLAEPRKVLAPQSTIPGMFVVVLPLLYCPMTWGYLALKPLKAH